MRFVSYNIQYGTGKDGRVDLGRIADEIRGADVMALQEVERFWSRSGGADQPALLAEHFPDYHWVYGAGIDLDASERDRAGRLIHRRRQFGNMLLARWPIVSSRTHLLPKMGLIEQLSLQRCALETVITLESGPIRIYSVHLGHAAAAERMRQVERLLEIVRCAPLEGGVWSGRYVKAGWALDGPPPPMPAPAVLLGDFNLRPDSPEYERLCGGFDPDYGRAATLDGLIDAWIAAGHDPAAGFTQDWKGKLMRIDYAFVTADLRERIGDLRVDQAARGSDHQPIWLELEL